MRAGALEDFRVFVGRLPHVRQCTYAQVLNPKPETRKSEPETLDPKP